MITARTSSLTKKSEFAERILIKASPTCLIVSGEFLNKQRPHATLPRIFPRKLLSRRFSKCFEIERDAGFPRECRCNLCRRAKAITNRPKLETQIDCDGKEFQISTFTTFIEPFFVLLLFFYPPFGWQPLLNINHRFGSLFFFFMLENVQQTFFLLLLLIYFIILLARIEKTKNRKSFVEENFSFKILCSICGLKAKKFINWVVSFLLENVGGWNTFLGLLIEFN